MAQALDSVMMAAEPLGDGYGHPPARPEQWAAGHLPPRIERPPYTARELYALFKGGEPEADRCEQLLAWASRARGGIDLMIGEGLDALRKGERLPQLGYHPDDYGREVLDLAERTTRNLAFLASELRSRPLLREAVRAGRVLLGAAQAVLPVAKGDAEAAWVERAATETVRALKAAVRAAGRDPDEPEEPWLRFCARIEPEERVALDEALALAGRMLPAGSSRAQRLEALSQEFLGEYPTDPSGDGKLGRSFGPLGPGPEPGQAALEAETGRWSLLQPVEAWPAPDPGFGEGDTAREIDARLRALAELRAGWDDVIGFCAHALKQSRIYQLLGFASFEHYITERLGLSARTVRQRVALQQRLAGSPALREARRQGLPCEKLRALSRLPEKEIGPWTPRAHALTCVELRRRLDAEQERQMSAARRISARLPRSVATLLSAAIEAVRAREGALLPAGKCLAIIARHFTETWAGAVKRRTPSQRTRERDGGRCTVPACSHPADDSHHVIFASHGGPDHDDNRTGVCRYHHHRSIHPGHVRVWGRAPDGLTWVVGGKVWRPEPA
jgi:hypothetical protein